MIEIKNLEFNYSKKKKVYSMLNMTIEEGAVYALLGLNGAGKTTLLNLIGGFLIPQKGSCEVFGYRSSERKSEMLKELFVVSDISDFPNITVSEFRTLYSDFYPRFDLILFEHCILEFGIKSYSSLKKLSFGDKRKVILSFALATKCKLLLFDEPTNGLDIPSKSIFRKLLAECFDEKQTIIMATHQVRDLANIMDRIIIEHQGKIVINESIDHITEKLSFGIPVDQISKEDLLYHIEGYSPRETVSHNRSHKESQVDIELLFNAVVHNPSQLSQLFNSKN